jgi:hypothetical protein
LRRSSLPTWLDVSARWEASGGSTTGSHCTRHDYRRVHRRCPLRITQGILSKQFGQVSQHLAYPYRRCLHPPDALIELVFGRRDSFNDLNGDGSGGSGSSFVVRGTPTPLGAPSRWPPRRPCWDGIPASRTYAGGSHAIAGGPRLGGRPRPNFPQPLSLLVDAHTPTPKFRTDGTAHSLCIRCVASVGRSAGPAVHPLRCPGRAVVVPSQSHGFRRRVPVSRHAASNRGCALPRPRNMGVSPLACPCSQDAPRGRLPCGGAGGLVTSTPCVIEGGASPCKLVRGWSPAAGRLSESCCC